MKSIQWGSIVLVVLGMLGPVAGVYGMFSHLDLVEVGVEATITSVSSGKNAYGSFTTGDGTPTSCKGRFRPGDTVVYDPAAPGRCRPDWAVGGFNSDERFWLTLGGFLILVGIVGFIFERYMTGDDELELALRGELPAPPVDADRQDAPAQVPEEEQRW